MGAFFEFCNAHPWQMGIVVFFVASSSCALGYVISSLLANGRIADIFRDLYNPANVGKRIERK